MNVVRGAGPLNVRTANLFGRSALDQVRFFFVLLEYKMPIKDLRSILPSAADDHGDATNVNNTAAFVRQLAKWKNSTNPIDNWNNVYHDPCISGTPAFDLRRLR